VPDDERSGRVAVPCTREQTVLGEGVRWDAWRGELLRVDIVRGRIYRDRADDAGGLVPVAVHEVPGTVGAVAPIEGGGGWLLAAGRGLRLLLPDGSSRLISQVAPVGTRMNDGACDSRGRFWAGTLAVDQRPGAGALYRFDGDGAARLVLPGLTISNGVDWSPDAATMYLADSGPGVVYAFDFDADTGALAGRRVLVTIESDVGAPDGLTVDAAGDLWVAVYGAGEIRHYQPDGVLAEVFAVPAAQTTCCAFGGPGLDRLYVTTATEGWTDEQRRARPGAGLVYRLDVGVAGRPAAPFVPGPAWWSAPGQAET